MNEQGLPVNDIVKIASNVKQLKLANLKQYPELTSSLQSSMTEYNDILSGIMASDDQSLQQFGSVVSRNFSNIEQEEEQVHDLILQSLATVNKELDKPNLTDEARQAIYSQQMALIEKRAQIAADVRKYEMNVVQCVSQKDSEKRHFHCGVISATIPFALFVVVIGFCAFSGNVHIQ